MHMKNFSLITRNNKTSLSPMYDLINSTIALDKAEEEIALSLDGAKRHPGNNDKDHPSHAVYGFL